MALRSPYYDGYRLGLWLNGLGPNGLGPNGLRLTGLGPAGLSLTRQAATGGASPSHRAFAASNAASQAQKY